MFGNSFSKDYRSAVVEQLDSKVAGLPNKKLPTVNPGDTARVILDCTATSHRYLRMDRVQAAGCVELNVGNF